MNPFAPNSWTLPGAWIALTAIAGAQASDTTTGTPPPRVPRPPLAVSAAPTFAESTFAEPAVTADALASRPLDPGAQAERPEREPREVVSLPMSHERYSRVHWDTEADGTIWVRGRNYKASFGAEGAIFYPLLGSDQPRHFPLELSLASATSGGLPIPLAPVTGAVRDGQRVIIDRGAIDEVYEIGVESMEQTFVVEERTQGDLKLVVRLETELGRSENTEGFEFSNEFGGVRYSHAFLRAADGAQLPLSTRAFGSELQIAVAAQDVAASTFPLVIDPVVSTFDVDATTYVNYDPDVAYDATTNHYLYVYMEDVAANDNDVYSEVVSGSGTVLGGAYVNLSGELMREVSVANLNAYDQFLVAMRDPTRVVGRVTGASSLSYSTQFLIHSGATPRSLSVGGDPYGAAPAYYCVVWDRSTVGPTEEVDVIARLVTNTGSLLGPGPLALATTTAAEFHPRVSKGNNGIQWNVVLNRGPAIPPGGYVLYAEDVFGAQIAWDGTSITTPAFPILLGQPHEFHAYPSVSSPVASGEYMVVWDEYVVGFSHDIFGARIAGGTVLSTMSISSLENAGNQARLQKDAFVETDGDRFVVAYNEYDSPSGDPRLHAASFAFLPGEVRCLEPNISLSTPGVSSYTAALVSTAASGGAQRRFALAWAEEASPTDENIRGAFFDALTVSAYCFGDGTGTACPCGNNGGAGRGCANSINSSGARLFTSGDSDVSTDNLVLQAIGMPNGTSCLFFQGTTTGPNAGLGATFGDGLRCTGGSTIRLAAKTTALGAAIYPQPGDPSISAQGNIPAAGGVRTYQVWYRNSATFCTASTFNLTNGARIVWLP